MSRWADALAAALLVLSITWSFSFTPADRSRPTATWGPFPDWQSCTDVWATVIKTLRDAGVTGAGDKLSWCQETVTNQRPRVTQ